jgi:hypothetical protein
MKTMCGQGGCHCEHGCSCGGQKHGGHRYGHGCHGEETTCTCGGSCECEQEAGGCQCGGGEAQSCGCGQGGHEDHHGRHEHHGHHEEHARGFQRRFISRAERIAELEAYLSGLRAEAEAGEAYLKDIQAEAVAVEERIAALKAA